MNFPMQCAPFLIPFLLPVHRRRNYYVLNGAENIEHLPKDAKNINTRILEKCRDSYCGLTQPYLQQKQVKIKPHSHTCV